MWSASLPPAPSQQYRLLQAFIPKLLHTAKPDKTRPSRPPVDRHRRDNARQAATPSRPPPTRSDVVRHPKCKQAVDCCIWRNLNFFGWTPRDEDDLSANCSDFAIPDGLESRDSIHTAWCDTDKSVLYCLADGVNWALEALGDNALVTHSLTRALRHLVRNRPARKWGVGVIGLFWKMFDCRYATVGHTFTQLALPILTDHHVSEEAWKVMKSVASVRWL